MKRKLMVVLASLIFFSSSFLGFSKEEAEALCNPGNFAALQADGKFKCTSVNSNGNTASSEDSGLGANGLDNMGDNGPQWVKNFSKFMLGLAVAVAYFSEVVAMLSIAYASYLYTTSEGDVKKTKQAKTLIMYAFVGMFIGAFSLIISKMVGGAL